MKKYADTFIKQFRDEELAHAHVDDFLNIYIATQLRVLREQRGQTQTKLAELAGMEQPRISVMEDIDYNSWSISTLKKLARAFDVSLKVSFESFDTLIADTGNFSEGSLMRDTRAEALRKLEDSQHASDKLDYGSCKGLEVSTGSTAGRNLEIYSEAAGSQPGILNDSLYAADSDRLVA